MCRVPGWSSSAPILRQKRRLRHRILRSLRAFWLVYRGSASFRGFWFGDGLQVAAGLSAIGFLFTLERQGVRSSWKTLWKNTNCELFAKIRDV